MIDFVIVGGAWGVRGLWGLWIMGILLRPDSMSLFEQISGLGF